MKDYITRHFRKIVATVWNKFYFAKYYIAAFNRRNQGLALLILILSLVCLNIYLLDIIQLFLEPYFQGKDNLLTLQTFLITIGGALVGASAIVFTLVSFAMQVNVERLPYGLFHKLSDDKKLLVAFTGTIVFAVAIALSALIPDSTWVAIALTCLLWGIFIIIVLFIYTYKRALSLINPVKQLEFLLADTENDFNQLIKRIKRIAPLIENENVIENDSHDMPRLMYFQNDPNWNLKAKQAIKYAISFATSYAEKGDHEVSNAALISVIRINTFYIKAKGLTFFNSNGFIPNPLESDSFINDTLEQMRQVVKTAVVKGNEQFIEQSLAAIHQLAIVYMGIDYGKRKTPKSHAILALGYLSEAVKSVAPHNMTDVLMEGTRILGKSAQILINVDEPINITTTVETIKLLACMGALQEIHRPVTMVAMEQFSALTMSLLGKQDYDIQHAAETIRNSILMISKLFFSVPETALQRIHSHYLAPYYSCTDSNALGSKLAQMANAILDREADDADAIVVIKNVERWADGLYQTEKEILLLSIEKRSSIFYDILNWIKSIFEILLTISNSLACNSRMQKELQEHALWLISTFTFIPSDKESAAFVENYQFVEILFDTAIISHDRESREAFDTMQKLLLKWGFQAGQNQVGYRIQENSIYALSTLCFMTSYLSTNELKEQLKNLLITQKSMNQEYLNEVSANIREKAYSLYGGNEYSLSTIEYRMNQTNLDEMKQLLLDLAEILLNNTDVQKN